MKNEGLALAVFRLILVYLHLVRFKAGAEEN